MNKSEIPDFLQDFGCARIGQLRILCNAPNENFKNLLNGRMVSQKGDILVHNTKVIDNNMLIALDVLCKYTKRLKKFYKGYNPIYITFLTKDNLLYHIIVADEGNEKGVVKIVNAYPLSLPEADKLILIFNNREELDNIKCTIPYLYCSYPTLEVLN